MQIIDDRALVLRVRDPHKVSDAISHSKVLPDNKVVVRWGLDECRILRDMNIKAPSPIEKKYKWTGQYAPFEHQKTTAAFLTLRRKAFCFNEQGTGKTASAIWASDYLLSQGIINRVLIVCPLSIMDSAWRDDLFKFAMHRTVDIAYGSAKKRKEIVANDAEYIITNYDGLAILEKDLQDRDLIIVDEATHYKNARTDRWKVLNRMVKPDTWVWMMTGTPAAQSPLDAYGLAKIINPNSVPRFYGSFRDQVMIRVSQFKWMPKPDSSTIVYNALQPAIRFTKDECLDLPPMVYTKREVELTRQQKKYYKELKGKMVMQAAGEQITAVNAAVNMNKLLQISSGAVYTDEGDALEFDISHRYKVLREVIDESSKKVLVFVPFKHAIDLITDKLNKDGIRTDYIRGDVSAAKRTDIFKRFQTQDDLRVLVIQPQAAAHGVTLTAANTVVWWGPTSSLETYAQANARVHRSGQDHKCTVVQLQGSGIEKRVYRLLDSRIDVHTQIISLYQEILD
jgi:SNF2 family DNA or RNA helicase